MYSKPSTAKMRRFISYIILIFTILILVYTVLADNKGLENLPTTYGAYETKAQSSNENSKYGEIEKLTSCEYTPLEFRVQQRSTFWVFRNFIKAKKRFKCFESVTLTTNGDFRFLGNLVPLIKRWKGPVSLAIYSPGDDFYKTLDAIAYLRNCETVLIKDLVTFHLFFDFLHTPHKINTSSLYKAYKDTYSCAKKPPYINVDDEKTYKATKNLTYPINVARNIARENVQTYYVFPSDIELYMSYNFIDKFLSMLLRNKTLITDPHPRVFVLPIFEVVSTASVPGSKKDLQRMYKNQTAFLFHQKLCAICHKVPKDKEWMAAEEGENLNVFTVGKRLNYHRFWEAFYVGTNADPIFDERLTWEGQSNKMAQGFSMCLLDYDYMVLDNAFLIHKPGIKKEKEQIKKFGRKVAETTYLVRHHIKPELEAIYGKREGCMLG